MPGSIAVKLMVDAVQFDTRVRVVRLIALVAPSLGQRIDCVTAVVAERHGVGGQRA